MDILVYELDHNGHRLTYVRLLIEALMELGCNVHFATDAAQLGSDEFADQIAPLRSRIEVITVPAVTATVPMDIAKARVDRLQSVVKNKRFDTVFIPSADGIAQVAALRALTGRAKELKTLDIEIVIHHGGFAYPATSIKRKMMNGFTRQLFRSGPWRHVHFVDLIVSQWAQQHDQKLAARSGLLPDPIESVETMAHEQARAILNIPITGRIIGCAGGINRRKSADVLLEAFANAPLNDNDRLLLAGRAEPEIAALIQSRYAHLVEQHRLIVLDRFLSFAELHAAISAMNVVALLYVGHQAISSILLRAVAADRPVLALPGGWIERMTRQFDLGVFAASTSTEECAAAIASAFDFAANYRRTPAIERLMQFHSEKNFGAVLTARVAEKMGKSLTHQTMHWQQVCSDSDNA